MVSRAEYIILGQRFPYDTESWFLQHITEQVYSTYYQDLGSETLYQTECPVMKLRT